MHVFHNFKGFKQAELDLFNPLTILIGPNGSGKSNLIEGIELFSFIARGRPLHEIVDVGRGGGLEIRGGLQSCPRGDGNTFSFDFSASIKFSGSTKAFRYKIRIQAKPHPRIAEESLAFYDGTMIFQTIGQSTGATSGDIAVKYNNFARGGQKPKASVSSNYSVLSRYKEFAKKNKRFNSCSRLVDSIMFYLRSSFVFDPNPKLMRAYERIGNGVLSRDGANLSSVLFEMSQGNTEGKKSVSQLLEWIRQLPEEPFQRIDFVTTPLNDVIFGLNENDTSFIDARLLSDGTLRCLAVLTALETVEPGARLIVEEFDNGLHPSRVRVLLEAIKSCCERKKINVLVTTHNPATLNALQPDQLDGVVLCVRDRAEEAYKLIRLDDLPRCDELLERGNLGDLVTRRIVEHHLAPNFEANHKQKALEWLENLP